MKPEFEGQEVLIDELARLSKQQDEFLQRSIFLKFSDREAVEFDRRAFRIAQINRLLGVHDSKYGAA